MAETSTKPYLIRAIHEWCADNGFTPYIAVAVDARTRVPREFVRNGEIVLNVSMMATHRLKLGNDFIEFQARFGGTPRELSIPVENVSAIYARENGHGMAFEVPKAAAVTEDDASADSPIGEDADGAAPEGRGAAEGRRGPAVVPALVPASAALPAGEGGAHGDAERLAGGGTDVAPPSLDPSGTTAGGERTPRSAGRSPLRSAGGRNEGGAKAPGSRRPARGKQVLAVVPDSTESRTPPAPPGPAASPSRGDDEPPDPNDNPPRQSPPRLTRIK